MRRVFGAMLLGIVLITGGSVMKAEWNAAAVPEQIKVIESEALSFAWDGGTGLGKIYDKRTGQTWSQYWMLPPVNAEIPQVPLTDTSYWTATQRSATGEDVSPERVDGSVAFVLDDRFATGSIQTVFSGTKISKGSYRMEVVYHADQAVCFDMTLRADFHAGNYDYKRNAKAHLGSVERTERHAENGQVNERSVWIFLKHASRSIRRLRVWALPSTGSAMPPVPSALTASPCGAWAPAPRRSLFPASAVMGIRLTSR